MNKTSLSKTEAISIIIICFINESIINYSQNFIASTGTGSLANLFEIGIIAFFVCIILNKLFKNFTNLDIIDISEYLGGKVLKYIVSILFTFFFIIICSFTISNFSYLLKTIYFHESPIIFVSGLFILGMLVSNLTGLNSIKKFSCFILPILIICIGIIFFSSLSHFHIYKLTPILGKNLKTTFLIGLNNLFVFNIFIFYFFLMPLLKNKSDFSKIVYSSFIIAFIIILLIIICLLTAFPYFGSSEELNPIYILTRSIELTSFLQRIDAIFVYFSIICTFVYTSILVFWIIEILGKLYTFENKKMLSFPISILIFGFSIFIFQNHFMRYTKTNIYQHILLGFIFGPGLIILISANIKKSLQNINLKKQRRIN